MPVWLQTLMGGVGAAAIAGLFGLSITRPKLFRSLAIWLLGLTVLWGVAAACFALGVMAGAQGESPDAPFAFAQYCTWGFGALMLLIAVSFIAETHREQGKD